MTTTLHPDLIAVGTIATHLDRAVVDRMAACASSDDMLAIYQSGEISGLARALGLLVNRPALTLIEEAERRAYQNWSRGDWGRRQIIHDALAAVAVTVSLYDADQLDGAVV